MMSAIEMMVCRLDEAYPRLCVCGLWLQCWYGVCMYVAQRYMLWGAHAMGAEHHPIVSIRNHDALLEPPRVDFSKKVAKNGTSMSDISNSSIDIMATKGGQLVATNQIFAPVSRFIETIVLISNASGNFINFIDRIRSATLRNTFRGALWGTCVVLEVCVHSPSQHPA
jgi:hypothetical protein